MAAATASAPAGAETPAAAASSATAAAAPLFHPAGPRAVFQELTGKVVQEAPVELVPPDHSDPDWGPQHCYWQSGRDRLAGTGPLHCGTDAAAMLVSGDLQSYSWIEPDWKGTNGPGEVAMFSPIKVSLVITDGAPRIRASEIF